MAQQLMAAAYRSPNAPPTKEMVATYGAHIEAIERYLGVPTGDAVPCRFPRREQLDRGVATSRHREDGRYAMKVDFANKTVGGFNFEFVRGLSLQAAGAAEYGECMDTMSRVKNNNFDSWISQWAATADRVAAFADREDRVGNRVSARDAFLRAANYYRMAVFYAAHTDARHTQLWRRSKDCFHRMIALMRHSRRVRGHRLRRSTAAGLLRLRRRRRSVPP